VIALKRHLDQRLRLQHLRVVDAIAARGSLLKASAALNLTQPTLSKTLHEAEEIARTKLFDRHPRGMKPTVAGLSVIEAGRRVLAELKRLEETLDVIDGPQKSVLALGVLPVAASGMLPGALTRMRLEHPEITVRVEQGRTEDLTGLLAAGEIDLIVGRLYEPPAPDAFEREPLWSEPIAGLVRAGHPLLEKTLLEAEDLRAYDLVLPTVSQRVGQEIDWILQRLGLERTVAYRSSSYGFIREMLFGGDFVSIVPSLMMAGDLVRGSLKLVPLPIPAAVRLAGVIRPAGRELGAPAWMFMQVLRSFVRDLVEQGLADIASDITPGDS
jgi:LysR family transcriptional regulator, pca operon transcriptional activator